MSIKILTENSIDNTNIDGARQNHFSAGMRSGIVKGAFNEGKFFASASNIIALDSCELRISGHQVVIDSAETITLNDRPSTPTKYSMIAEIQVSDSSVPSFRLFIQPANVSLKKDNLFKTNNGSGTYQLRIGNFTLGTTGLISDVVRTADIITGGGEGGIADIKFNATATQLSSSSQPEVNADYNEETKEWDLNFGIPAGSGSKVTIGGVEQPTWSADFAESERQKTLNLFDYRKQPSVSYLTNNQDGTFTISNMAFYYPSWNINVDLKPNTQYSLSQTIVSVSDSAGLSQSGVSLNVVVFYTDGTYSSTGSVYISGNGRVYGVLTTNEKTIKNIEYRAIAKNNNTSVVNAVVSDICIVEGESDKFYEYNGAIVHKKDIAGLEKFEDVYNRYSTDPNINWGKTSGILGGVTIENKNFSKYKRLEVYVTPVYNHGMFVIDLERLLTSVPTINSGYCGGIVLPTPDNKLNTYTCYCYVNQEKTSFTHFYIGYVLIGSPDTYQDRNNAGSYCIDRIVGVY